jgi:hypothetical protein
VKALRRATIIFFLLANVVWHGCQRSTPPPAAEVGGTDDRAASLAPQAEQPITTSRHEVESWVSAIQSCVQDRKWKCVEKQAKNLLELDDPQSRAFGSWALGLVSLDRKEFGVAFRYFGLAVRDNPYRYAFQRWFALGAFCIRRFDISERHLRWASAQGEGRNDREMLALTQVQMSFQNPKDGGAPATDALKAIRTPAGRSDNVLSDLFQKSLGVAIEQHCMHFPEKPSLCTQPSAPSQGSN